MVKESQDLCANSKFENAFSAKTGGFMKNRIRISIFMLVVIVVGSGAVLFLLDLKVGAQQEQHLRRIGPRRVQECCDYVTGRGQGVMNATGAFVVDAVFNLSGGPYSGVFGAQTLQIKSTTRLLYQDPPTPAGVINAITSHVLEVKGQSDEDGICEDGEDCLVTLDRASLIVTAAPGVLDLKSVLAVSDGKGRFTGACGKFDATDGQGQINMAATPPTVFWSFNGGSLCKCD